MSIAKGATMGELPGVAAERMDARSEMELRIRRTAIDLFFSQGFSAVGIRQIGAGVGIGVPTLYHYVKSKPNLLTSIMIDTLEILLDRLRHSIDGVSDPRERLARLTGVLVATQASSPKTSFVIDNELRALEEDSSRILIVSLRDEVEKLFKATLDEGVRENMFKVDNLVTSRLSIIGLATSTNSWFSGSGKLTLKEVCHDYMQIALSIVGAHRLSEHYAAELIGQFPITPFPWEPNSPVAASS
ncbi:TetR/AcrR family transcriptional regulator [Rhodococcus sp. IEGM1428]|uniref:TetR/AcrR family transcriptional regulator n=1 Tax=Rhodococcus sp. IEGM1428 TaxID=3392191 RepID=UPI003D0C901C